MTWAIYIPDEKKLKRYWEVGIKLSINDNTRSPKIYTLPQFLSMSEKNYRIYDIRDMFYDLKTQLIQFTDWQKSLEQFTDQIKKAKKVLESWKWTFHKGQYLKSWNINLASVSVNVRKILLYLLPQVMQFTD